MENTPVFMALGSEAYTIENGKEFFKKVLGPKKMHFAENTEHFDLYWKSKHVKPISENLNKFFRSYLA